MTQPTETTNAADVLQLQHSAMKVSFTWWGTTKALRPDLKKEIADDFDADEEVLSASKKLINRKHPAYRAMTGIKRSIVAYWKQKTLPFPEPGIRLLPQSKLEEFDTFMESARADLREAADELQAAYEQNRTLGATLGRLHDDHDYPATVNDLFSIAWNVENITPPDYLLELKPEFYQREMQRIRGLFDNAVELAEGEFVEEFGKLVTSLVERLSDNEDGTPKVYRKGCVDKLKSFIDRFKDLSIHSNDELEKLVGQCESLTKGVDGTTFRDLPDIRKHVAGKLAEVKEAMEKDLVLRPRRKITRRPSQEE